jgi:anti-sigma B factor antagonist
MLQVHTTKLGNVAVLCVQGKIVCGETEGLSRAVLAQTKASIVALDLLQVNTVDAGGLGALLELREHCESRGIEFRLENVTRPVRRILEITRLDSVFKISRNSSLEIPKHRRPLLSLEMPYCA